MCTRLQAAEAAHLTTHNTVGMCQAQVRTWFDAPGAGDRDHDGDFDAYDGWLSEPLKFRHPGDRYPPRGVPVSFSGGSHGHGHRAISMGSGRIRSTDMYGGLYHPGLTSNCSIEDIERHMNQHYLGWSETMDGLYIPH